MHRAVHWSSLLLHFGFWEHEGGIFTVDKKTALKRGNNTSQFWCNLLLTNITSKLNSPNVIKRYLIDMIIKIFRFALYAIQVYLDVKAEWLSFHKLWITNCIIMYKSRKVITPINISEQLCDRIWFCQKKWLRIAQYCRLSRSIFNTHQNNGTLPSLHRHTFMHT